jgi:hypothetical protein
MRTVAILLLAVRSTWAWTKSAKASTSTAFSSSAYASGTICPGNGLGAQVNPGYALNVSSTIGNFDFNAVNSNCAGGPNTVLTKHYWHVFNLSVGPVLRAGNGTYISGNLCTSVSIP